MLHKHSHYRFPWPFSHWQCEACHFEMANVHFSFIWHKLLNRLTFSMKATDLYTVGKTRSGWQSEPISQRNQACARVGVGGPVSQGSLDEGSSNQDVHKKHLGSLLKCQLCFRRSGLGFEILHFFFWNIYFFGCIRIFIAVNTLSSYGTRAQLLCGTWGLSYPVCMLSHFSWVWLFATSWTVAHQGSSVHGILQATILEWVPMPSSTGSSQPRSWTRVSCIAGRFFTAEPPGKPLNYPTRDQIFVLSIARQIVNHWTTGEVPAFLVSDMPRLLVQKLLRFEWQGSKHQLSLPIPYS